MNQLTSLSNKELFSISLNATAGAVNFYLAPVSFGLGFSVAFTSSNIESSQTVLGKTGTFLSLQAFRRSLSPLSIPN